jgi:hypothetical protein
MNYSSPRWVGNRFARAFYQLLYIFIAAAIFAALTTYFEQRDFVPLATICVPILAILFGFSSLMYNRARALPSGPEQRRSLYAAERGLQAIVLFLIGIGPGGLGAILIHSLSAVGNQSAYPKIVLAATVLFYGGMLLALYSFGCFFLGIRAIAHKLFRWIPLRRLARSVR